MRSGRPATAAAVLTAAALISACGSSSKHASTTNTTSATTTSPSTATAPTTATGSGTTTGTTGSTLPAPSTSGPLTVSATVALPIGLPAGQPVAAEGPDGAVFVNDQPAGEVYVVDGNGPPAVAEHVSGTVSALAASSSDLYVATFTTLYDFNRTSGNLTTQLSLPAVSTANISDALPVAMAYADATLWVLITQGNDVDVYRLDPATGGLLEVETTLGAAVGNDGTLYYESTGGDLVSLSTSGTTTTGPQLSTHSNGEGGGVQFVDGVAGGYVWTMDDAGQGLDASYEGYSTTSLAAGPTAPGTTGVSMADTLAGPLWRSGAESSGCPAGANACVLRLGPAAALSDGLATGAGAVLLGPYPALVGPQGSSLELQRLS